MATLQSLRIAPKKFTLVGVDMDLLAPGLLEADASAVVPPCSSSKYVPALLKLCSRFEIKVVIPTVDEEVSVLARAAGKFRGRGIALPIPPAGTVRLARDKLRVARFNWRGVDVPRTVSFDSVSGLSKKIATVQLPCVVKQRVGRGGRGFGVIETIEDAIYWRRNQNTDLILQEKIDGDLLLVQGLAKGGRLLVSIVHKRLAVKSPGSGTATAAVTVKDTGAVDALQRVVRQLEWEGALGVEFIHDRDSGKYFLIDINPRICGQSHLSTMAGLNLAYGLVQLAKGRKVTVGPSYKSGLAFVRTWRDIGVPYDELVPHRRTANR